MTEEQKPNHAFVHSHSNAGLGDFLPVPPRGRLADQCRHMGIVVGDIIQSHDAALYREGGWHEKRLTLLWIGEQAAVFKVQERSDLCLEWSESSESANWTLDCRRWVKRRLK